MVALGACTLAFALCGAGETTLLEFSADWCGPCKMMEPTVRRLAAEGHSIRQINVDRDRQAAAQYQVTGVPCFVMLVDGREVDRVVGAASYARLQQMFAAAGRNPPQGHGDAGSLPPGRRPTLDARSTAPAGDRAADEARPSRPAPAAPAPLASLPPASAKFDLQSGHQQAQRATVRLQVEDPQGYSVGSGTLIDQHGAEALIITCGHIFRTSAGKGRIRVDLFGGPATRTVEGQLISYDLERDIGLVSITPGVAIQPVRVAPAGHRLDRGAGVFSVGCDKGGEPRVQDSRITAIDKYLGPPNIETSGQPVDGRSGGGLYSGDGYLIGVCNAADPADNEGIFASLPTIHWELDRVGQRRIYEAETPPPMLAANAAPRTIVEPPITRSDDRSPAARVPDLALQLAGANGTVIPALSAAEEDTEVICIVRSGSGSQRNEQLFVLDRPSRDLLDRLAHESRSQEALSQVALQTSRGRPEPNRAAPPRGVETNDRGEVVRAQSADR